MHHVRLQRDYRQAFLMRFSGYCNDSAPVFTIGSFYPFIYYGFYCEPRHMMGYILLITLSGIGAWASSNYARRHKSFS